MPTGRLVVLCVALAWLADMAHAQPRPDFSGTWAAVYPPVGGTAAVPGTPAVPASAGDMGSGWGASLTIAQDATRLRVDDAVFSRYDLQPPLTYVYPLDGSDSRAVVAVGRGEQVQVSRARWDGTALVITTIFQVADGPAGTPFTFEMTRRLSLESVATLIVETTRAGVLGGPPASARATYRRQ